MAKDIATARFIENVRTFVDNNRTHTIICDLPPAKGGDDTGPTAIELAVMALADCTATIFAKVAKESNIEVKDIKVVAEAEKSEDSPLLTGVKVKVNVSAKAREQLLKAIWRRTEETCPVVAIFKDPIPVEFELETETVE